MATKAQKHFVVYHNPRCSKSRCAVNYIKDRGDSHEIRDYMNDPFTVAELKHLLQQLGLAAHELLRQNEDEYKRLIKGKQLSESELIDLMIAYPKLIQRPIVVSGERAVIARPEELINKL